MEHHLDLAMQERVAGGVARDEARYAAQRTFGGVVQIKERCRDERARGLVWIEHLAQDLSYAARALRRNLGFTVVVVVTLALGIGANTAIFSAVYSVLWRALPYSDSDRLFTAHVVVPQRTGTLPGRVQDLIEWREAKTPFSDVAGVRPGAWVLTGTGEPERLGGAVVSANFFSLLGVAMQHGRAFVADEERPGNDRVVIISDGLWQRRFASDPNVIGRTLVLNAEAHTVVGVAPRDLVVPTGEMLHPMLSFASRIELWKPLAPTASELQGESWNVGLLLRLREHGGVAQGGQQLQAMLNRSIRTKLPDLKFDLTVQLVPLREIFSGRVRERLLLVLGASVLLLAIACTNLTRLFLSRVAQRSTELATRVALGAGRGRMMR